MAKFFFADKLFRWSKATAAQINDKMNRVRDWTVSNLSTDSLLPLSVDTRHHKEPLTYLLSSHAKEIGGVAVGAALAEVEFDHSALGAHKVSAFGCTWYRNRDGDGDGVHTATADFNRICWYDSNAAAYDLAAHEGRQTSGTWSVSSDYLRWGCDHTFGNPLPGIGWAVGGLLFENGGNQMMASTLVKEAANVDWPPAPPVDVHRFGVMGQDSAVSTKRSGQAQIWLFAEDNKK